MTYYANGKVKYRGANLDGQMHGPWEWFRTDGSVMRTGQFDLVVAMTTERVSDLAVKTWTERLVWIAAPDQKPAADRPLPLICYPEGCVYRARMLKRLAEDGLPWRIAMT